MKYLLILLVFLYTQNANAASIYTALTAQNAADSSLIFNNANAKLACNATAASIAPARHKDDKEQILWFIFGISFIILFFTGPFLGIAFLTGTAIAWGLLGTSLLYGVVGLFAIPLGILFINGVGNAIGREKGNYGGGGYSGGGSGNSSSSSTPSKSTDAADNWKKGMEIDKQISAEKESARRSQELSRIFNVKR